MYSPVLWVLSPGRTCVQQVWDGADPAAKACVRVFPLWQQPSHLFLLLDWNQQNLKCRSRDTHCRTEVPLPPRSLPLQGYSSPVLGTATSVGGGGGQDRSMSVSWVFTHIQLLRMEKALLKGLLSTYIVWPRCAKGQMGSKPQCSFKHPCKCAHMTGTYGMMLCCKTQLGTHV